MFKNRKVQMLVAIALIVTVLLVTISAVNPAGWPPQPNLSAYSPGERRIAPPSYRSPTDECFDVPLRELTACRDEIQSPGH